MNTNEFLQDDVNEVQNEINKLDLIKASLIVMSHLSDIQEMIVTTSGIEAKERINFVKYIIMVCKGDLNKEINPDAMYSKFQSTLKTLGITK